ncbi:peptidoglycan DD-metalloendopeptidase family protein [Aquirufa aurantiipilula]|uniref:peptidoglycan DD-metalloendopeptidase family protein n=1 Tax=Aquirufa aurantiipilula TaxID=2696561 RepID=UPI001CAA7109|nr:peptidoglycan DD-metalloendopeptidase family protein [Aquirufa aurantiipilula]MBZ1326717.1 peptidoglycan DD-metalloendopeptidase family protein [Aquirufa aurantiipilula]
MISSLFVPLLSDSNSQTLDLSIHNPRFTVDIYEDISKFSQFIQDSIGEKRYGLGGYLEHRRMYETHENFATSEHDFRNIHLGIDIWAEAGTEVFVPMDGIIHSFQVNEGAGNYGPTIILEHQILGERIYSLYGHLAGQDLVGLFPGKEIRRGEHIAHLGNSSENGGWPPHLHFQLIRDLQGFMGDYPGVCSQRDMDFYAQNCPDPRLLAVN